MDKFNFLRSYTDGRAAEVIQNLDTTMENYEAAIEILRSRYEKPDLLQASHVNAIIALNPVNSRSDYKGLRHLHNQMMCHITSLESAGMSWESYAATLGPIVIGKLPSEMRVEWRKIDKNTFSSFRDLMGFIEAEAEGQEYASIIGEQEQTSTSESEEEEVPHEVPYTGSATQLATTAQQYTHPACNEANDQEPIEVHVSKEAPGEEFSFTKGTANPQESDAYFFRGEHVGNTSIPTTVTGRGRQVYAPQRHGIG
jgi:hypothetical protein